MADAQQNPPTAIGKLTATGTGEARDRDGNLLDNKGNVVAPQPDKESN